MTISVAKASQVVLAMFWADRLKPAAFHHVLAFTAMAFVGLGTLMKGAMYFALK